MAKATKTEKALPFAPLATEAHKGAAWGNDWHIAIGAKGRNGTVQGLAPARMFAAIAAVSAKAGKYAGTATVADYVAHFDPLLAKSPLPGNTKAAGILRYYARKGVVLVGPASKPSKPSKPAKPVVVATEAAIAQAAEAVASDGAADVAHDTSALAGNA
jgi:hypothetical protein